MSRCSPSYTPSFFNLGKFQYVFTDDYYSLYDALCIVFFREKYIIKYKNRKEGKIILYSTWRRISSHPKIKILITAGGGYTYLSINISNIHGLYNTRRKYFLQEFNRLELLIDKYLSNPDFFDEKKENELVTHYQKDGVKLVMLGIIVGICFILFINYYFNNIVHYREGPAYEDAEIMGYILGVIIGIWLCIKGGISFLYISKIKKEDGYLTRFLFKWDEN